jgi:Protein of unknown function (DUF1573)
MSSKRILVVTMALLVVLTASLALAQEAPKADAAKSADQAAPRLTVVEPVKDFGTVPKGEKLNWAFTIKNTGTADLQIIAARPACGCTVADFDKVIKPGATGKVSAAVDTTAFNGPIAKAVTLETNDPVSPTANLTIHATVKPYVEAYPAGFVRYSLLQGDAETQSLTLYSEEDAPFEITKIEVPGEWVKATYTKIEKPEEMAPGVGKPGQAQYKVNITVGGPDAKVGPLAEKIRIFTNSKHQPEYPVSVAGVIRPPFRVEPTALNFGEVASNDTAATRTIVVRSNDLKMPERFQVTKVESSLPAIAAAVKPTANKGEFEVTLQVAKDAKPGDVEGTVKIYTNNEVNPIVTVPMKATVKVAPKAAASK